MIRPIALLTAASLTVAGCNTASDTTTGPVAPSTPVAAVAPPKGVDWLTTVVATPDGGFLKGNPNAPVKLAEYGALSCPHCAHFAHESRAELDAMIASGKVSYELRTYIIHPQDLPASLLARCNGAGPFYALADQFFTQQESWMAKTKDITPDDQKKWATMAPNQFAADMAGKLGLVDFVKARGVSEDKAKACLADKAAFDMLQNIVNTATDKYHVTGTPTFILNGAVVPDTVDWATLKPKLKVAMGG